MKSWYLLYCKRGAHQIAMQHLLNQGVESYCPQMRVEKIRRGKRELSLEPLFASYLFIYFEPQGLVTWSSIRSTRGVVDFVRIGVEPIVVLPSVIESVKQLESKAQEVQPLILTAGQRVKIIDGNMAGVEAIYHEPDGDKRSILLIELLGKQVPMSLDNKALAL